MNFDKIIDRRGTNCSKWDSMEKIYGVPAENGIPMWVADMDFEAAPCIQDAVKAMYSHGVYGYKGNEADYKDSIIWWMQNRHQWHVEPEWIMTTQGLVNAIAVCLDIYTKQGDGIVLFTPVYHAFSRSINAAGREVVECPLVNDNNSYALDIEAYDAQMTGKETMLILSSPHNPGGRVWSRNELDEIAEFAKRHDLLLVSDEIHQDLVFSGSKHIPMALIDDIDDRLIMLTSASKTFNIAGTKDGNVIIKDQKLRDILSNHLKVHAYEPNVFGMNMVNAAYSIEGAKWVDELTKYLSGNIQLFDAGIASITGLKSMPLQSTYLSWVDFSATQLTKEACFKLIESEAKIAASHGTTFGTGGENFVRFNLGLPRELIKNAVTRLQEAFDRI